METAFSAPLRRVRSIVLLYDVEPLALATGSLTCGFGLLIALGTALANDLPARLFGLNMALAGGLQLVGLLLADWRVQVVGVGASIVGWAILVSLAWAVGQQLEGGKAELALYLWLVLTHSLVLWRMYWDWLRRPTVA
jgi:hypothetical protein